MMPAATVAGGESVFAIHNARTFTERFFEMETARGLFGLTESDGLLCWDIVRHDVYYSLWAQCGGSGARRVRSPARGGVAHEARNAYRRVQAWLSRRRVRSRAPRYLFVTASRSRHGDEWVDVIAEPCVQRYRSCSFVLESFSKQSRYLKRADGAFTAFPQQAWAVDVDRIVAAINLATREYFAGEIEPAELSDIVLEGIRAYRDQLRYFDELFRAHKPAAMVVVSNGVMKGFFHAARRHGIPSFELQHGLISRLHPYYSYPSGIDYTALSFHPQALLTFSEFWGRQIHFAGISKVVIGSEHYRARTQVEPAGKRDGLLVITAERYHTQLSEVARELARRSPQLTVFYKLHPQQYGQIESIRAELSGYPAISVCAGEHSVAELFARTEALLTVQSTVVYEALQAQSHVILLKHDDYHVHDDVFQFVHLCDDATAVAKAMRDIQSGGVPRPASLNFFDPFDGRVLDRLLGWPEPA